MMNPMLLILSSVITIYHHLLKQVAKFRVNCTDTTVV